MWPLATKASIEFPSKFQDQGAQPRRCGVPPGYNLGIFDEYGRCHNMFNGFFCRDFGTGKWTYNSLLMDCNDIYIYTPVNMNVNVRLSDLHLGTTYVSFLSWQHPFDTSEFGYVQTQFRNDCQVDGHCFVSSQFACSRVQVKQVPTYRACSQGKHSFI